MPIVPEYTIDLPSALDKMCGELSRRLANSHMSTWRGDLLVSDPRQKVTLVIDRSKVKLAAPSRPGSGRPRS